MTYFVTITLAECGDASWKPGDQYAHVFKHLTIYRHKIENWNPKKKSTGKNIFFTKVLRPEKRKKKHPPKMAEKPDEKVEVPFLGDQI